MSLASTSNLENLKLSSSGAAVSFLFISSCLSSSQPRTKCTDYHDIYAEHVQTTSVLKDACRAIEPSCMLVAVA